MHAKRRSLAGVEVLDLTGKITVGEGDVELKRAVQDLLDSGAKKILLDMEGIRFMDSAGLGELVACQRRAHQNGARIKIVRPSGKVADLLSLTKIGEFLEVFEDEGEALASF
jgi:anti-sigma B factor antagonist